MLKTGGEAHHDTARGTDGVAGKEPSKIDDINNVGEILPVDLKAHIQPLRIIHIRTHGGTYLKSGVDAPSREVDPIHNLLTVRLNFVSDALVKR